MKGGENKTEALNDCEFWRDLAWLSFHYSLDDVSITWLLQSAII